MTDTAPTTGPILVVDDEEAVLGLLKAQLEFAEYRVLAAGNGFEGVALLREHKDTIRLLVLDPKCPGTHDAIAVLDALRELTPRLPVLVVSGDLQEDAYRQIEAPKADDEFACDFLQKPYELKELEAKVARLLAS